MTDTNQAPPRRLTRSATDRVIGGVCGGLADFTGLDPVIFRVVIAVAAILGGAGLAVYLIAWLVIPPPEGSSHAESLLRDRELPKAVLAVLGVLAVIVLFGVDVGAFHGHGGGFPLLVILGLGLWFWSRHDRDPRPPVPPTPTSPLAGPPALPGLPPLPPVPPLPGAPRAPRDRSKLAAITLSAVLLVAGILAIAQVSTATLFPALLIVVGAGLLVGSLFGRARMLIGVGVVLTFAAAVASVADVPFRGGFGDRDWRPTTHVAREYHLAAGDAVLDLTELELDRDRQVEVTVGMGHLQVAIPEGLNVDVDAHVGFGRLAPFHDERGGVDRSWSDEQTGEPGPTLHLDLRLGMGNLEITR